MQKVKQWLEMVVSVHEGQEVGVSVRRGERYSKG